MGRVVIETNLMLGAMIAPGHCEAQRGFDAITAFPQTVDAFAYTTNVSLEQRCDASILGHTISTGVGRAVLYQLNGAYHAHGGFLSMEGRYVVRDGDRCLEYPSTRHSKTKWLFVPFYRSERGEIVDIDDGIVRVRSNATGVARVHGRTQQS